MLYSTILHRRSVSMASKALFAMMASCMLLVLPATPDTAAYADAGSYAINRSTVTFYMGETIECYESFQANPMVWGDCVSDYYAILEILDGKNGVSGVSWKSSDTSIVRVDAGGRVTPVSHGTATVSGIYKGKTYSCKVYVKDVRFYFWQEYTGAESKSRWAWDNACCMPVGTSVPYKLEEITYGPDKKESGRKDVTKAYPLEPEGPSYVRVSPGSITALKAGTDQLDITSGIHFVLKNTGVPYVQMVRVNVFTGTWDEFNKYLEIVNYGGEKELGLKPTLGLGGSFTLDDEFIQSPGWHFYRYTTKELTWKSSDASILTIDKVIGSMPEGPYGGAVYSTAKYTAHKKGKVTVTALLNNKKVTSLTFTAIPKEKAEQTVTAKAKSKTVGVKAVGKKKQVVSDVIKVKKARGKVTYKKRAPGSSENLDVNEKSGKIIVKKGTKEGVYQIRVTVTAAGDENYKSGSTTVTARISVVKKAEQPIIVKAKSKTVDVKAVGKKRQVIAKAIVVKKAKGEIIYKKLAKGSSKKLTIDEKNGKIIVKKGTKAGIYKIRVKVTAAGNKKYEKGSRTVTVTVEVR